MVPIGAHVQKTHDVTVELTRHALRAAIGEGEVLLQFSYAIETIEPGCITQMQQS